MKLSFQEVAQKVLKIEWKNVYPLDDGDKKELVCQFVFLMGEGVQGDLPCAIDEVPVGSYGSKCLLAHMGQADKDVVSELITLLQDGF